MARRKALIAAATAALTLLAGAAAISLNTSLVGASGDDSVGHVSPVERVDRPSPASSEPAGGATAGTDARRDVEDRHDDLGTVDRSLDDGRVADVDHDYEGADDDD
jgi:hypothetical protein